ncbi:hypothetical protein JTB14_029772 [Gonioctena quinquepunctata]|nr:hypothetical protein JTB14_029772 [Gonioctena quinquepunctata]
METIEQLSTEKNLVENKITEEDSRKFEKKNEKAKPNIPPLKIEPPPCLYPSVVTIERFDGKTDNTRVAKNTNKDQGKNPEDPRNNNAIKVDGKN